MLKARSVPVKIPAGSENLQIFWPRPVPSDPDIRDSHRPNHHFFGRTPRVHCWFRTEPQEDLRETAPAGEFPHPAPEVFDLDRLVEKGARVGDRGPGTIHRGPALDDEGPWCERPGHLHGTLDRQTGESGEEICAGRTRNNAAIVTDEI